MRFRLVFGAAAALFVGSLCGASETVKLQDPATNPGFIAFYNDDFEAAIAYFDQQVKAHPDDAAQYNHLAQSILFREMLRDGALESQLVSGNNAFLRRPKMNVAPETKQRFSDCINKALQLSSSRLKTDPRDPVALYSLAVTHGLRANYLFLVEKAWIDSLHEVTAARRLSEEVLRVDPNFIDARLILGLNQYVVGCLPFYLRVIGSIGGFHGDKSGGISQLELVSRSGVINRYDAKIILAAIYRREKCPEQAIPLLEDLANRFPRNCLFRFELVQMYSDAGKKEPALQVLAEIDALRRAGAPGYAGIPAEKVDYFKGNLLFWYGDLNVARTHLKQATKNVDELDLNTAVLAWLRLGQVCDLQGDHQEAIEAYRQTMKTAPQSAAASEAKSYISNPYRRKRNSA
jgi:tetratricopeptide (TPR) repeat protein